MSNITATTRGKIQLDQSTTPEIFNISVPVKDTEQSQLLPTNLKKILLRARNRTEIKFSYVLNESGTKYVTIPKGASYSDDSLLFNGSIYFQTTDDSSIVEILCWS